MDQLNINPNLYLLTARLDDNSTKEKGKKRGGGEVMNIISKNIMKKSHICGLITYKKLFFTHNRIYIIVVSGKTPGENLDVLQVKNSKSADRPGKYGRS